MKKFALLSAVAVMSFNTAAVSNNYQFVGQDESSATNLCLLAAQQGYASAKQFARIEQRLKSAEFDAIECNGQGIRSFARTYKHEVNSQEQVTEYQFKLVDSTEATKSCAYAAQNGLDQAIKRDGHKVVKYSCNGLPIRRFVRRYGQ